MNSTEITKWKFKDEKLSELIDRFGSMNKNDYEVALFHLMLENESAGLTDYDVSMRLRIPESKVKRLRYEVALRYQENTDIQADTYKAQLADMLMNCKYRIHNDRIQFAISDKMFRLYLNDMLMRKGRFADTSFNVNVVSMTADDLLFLISEINADSKKLIDKMKEDLNEKTTKLPKGMLESLKDLGKEVVTTAVKKVTTESMANELKEFTSTLCKKIIESINKGIEQ